MAKLESLGAIQTGSTPSTSNDSLWGGDFPFVTPAELDKSEPIFTTPRTLSEDGVGQARVVNKDAVMVCCIGSLGKVGLAGRPVVTNQQINSIEFYTGVVFPRYGFYACQRLKPKLTAMAPATTVPIVNKSKFGQLEIPLPPLPEQRRIAAILDKAELLRAKRRETVEQLDKLTQSIFEEMFGDVLSTGERTSLCTLVDEFRYGTSNKSGETGYPALRIPNVVGGSLDLADLKTVDVDAAELTRLKLVDGDLLFVRTNGNPDYVGRCSVFNQSLVASTGHEPSSFIYASYLIRARLKDDRILPTVLQFYLSTAEGRRELRSYSKTSAGQFNINIEGLGALRIPNFPMALQKTFVGRLAAIEKQRESLSASASEFDALFSSLQHRAFHGEL